MNFQLHICLAFVDYDTYNPPPLYHNFKTNLNHLQGTYFSSQTRKYTVSYSTIKIVSLVQLTFYSMSSQSTLGLLA